MLGRVDAEVRQAHAAVAEVDVVGERVADDLGLLVDFLGHEVAVIALVDQQGACHRFHPGPLHLLAGAVVDGGALAREHRPVALLQIGDLAGEGRQRDGVGAQVHLALAVADGERAALAGADHQVFLAGKDDGERERTLQMVSARLVASHRRVARLHLVGDQMHHHLGVGVGLELVALGGEHLLQLAEILDDAVVHHRDALAHVRVGVGLGGAAVRRPARVADADMALQRLIGRDAAPDS